MPAKLEVQWARIHNSILRLTLSLFNICAVFKKFFIKSLLNISAVIKKIRCLFLRVVVCGWLLLPACSLYRRSYAQTHTSKTLLESSKRPHFIIIYDAKYIFICVHVASTCVKIFQACVDRYITCFNAWFYLRQCFPVCVTGISNTHIFLLFNLSFFYLSRQLTPNCCYTQQCSCSLVIFTGCGLCAV